MWKIRASESRGRLPAVRSEETESSQPALTSGQDLGKQKLRKGIQVKRPHGARKYSGQQRLHKGLQVDIQRGEGRMVVLAVKIPQISISEATSPAICNCAAITLAIPPMLPPILPIQHPTTSAIQ